MRKILLAIAACVLFAVGLGAAGEATAATPPSTITGVVLKQATSVSNSSAWKVITLGCGGSKKVINAAGKIIDGSGEVVIEELLPSSDLKKVSVKGREVDKYSANWQVEVDVTCADPPSGLALESSASSNDTTTNKTTAAGCLNGQTMLGTGMEIDDGLGQVGTYRMYPELDAAGRPDTVEVKAAVLDPPDLSGSWQLKAYAICADPLYSQLVISAQESPTAAASIGLTAFCPAGSVATGTGYDMSDSVGEINVNGVVPGPTKGAATDRTSLTAFVEDPPIYTTYTPTAYVICANR